MTNTVSHYYIYIYKILLAHCTAHLINIGQCLYNIIYTANTKPISMIYSVPRAIYVCYKIYNIHIEYSLYLVFTYTILCMNGRPLLVVSICAKVETTISQYRILFYESPLYIHQVYIYFSLIKLGL